MYSRSSSSSPDILQPPGDADYLISSPIKPSFTGRQSFMSPANFRVLQTPRTAKGKRSRINLSPAKSSHSIRFDDVLLPASPSKKLNLRQRSMSPNKDQSDGNVSPWRIRVTLEATQDEENQGSPSRKRLKPATITTKIPLKDETEVSPRRRRGRPRKSDVFNVTSTPDASVGSPGNTPGPGGTSEQKRKRGRPRKSELGPDNGRLGVRAEQVGQAVAPSVELERSWSPLNLAGDAHSDDGSQDDPAVFENLSQDGNQLNYPDLSPLRRDQNTPHATLEPTYGTPNIDAMDHFYLQDDDDLHSTPSKMPSPTRDSQIVSPENTLNAGRTPRAPRTYTTRSSSSPAEEEKQGQNQSASPSSTRFSRLRSADATKDPTDEHREFDSIMESEGFSMVSLDTLPSARQHGLNSSSNLTKGALKPFLDRESNGVLKRKAHTLDRHDEDNSGPSKRLELLSASEQRPSNPDPQVSHQAPSGRLATGSSVYSPVNASNSTYHPPQRKPFLQLARIVRAGIALEGVLSHSSKQVPKGLLRNPGMYNRQDRVSDIEESRKRLELMFQDLDRDSQRVLRAGLGIGEQLAKMRRITELEAQRPIETEEPTADSPSFEYANANGTGTPRQNLDGTIEHETPSTEMKRRFDEWQREREAISRQIQMANSSQVIVIDSDSSGQQSPGSVENPFYQINGSIDRVSEQTPRQTSAVAHERHEEDQIETQQTEDEDAQEEEDYDEGEHYAESGDVDDADNIDDDDGYEDIWQQEARDPGKYSDHSPSVINDYQADVQPESASSPWKGGSTPAQRQYRQTFSPAYWVDGKSKVPFLGPSRIKTLREQEVDLSTLLHAENTPNRSRYYYGKSSPLSTANGETPGRKSPFRDLKVHNQAANHHGIEPDVQSEGSLDSISHSGSEDEPFQIDPTTRHESEMQRYELDLGGDANQSISDISADEERRPHEVPNATPRHSEHSPADRQASSWFQKITNFTPGWLKAPPRDSPETPHLPAKENVEDDAEDELSNAESTHDVDHGEARSEASEENEVEEPVAQFSSELQKRESTSPSTTHFQPENLRTLQEERRKPKERRPIPAASGYFSNEHYALLRRLYHLAKQSPERFPYHPGPGHSDIIGDWIWTSDGTYGVPVTELQFAIIHRFARELAAHDLKSGGTGQVGWSEADLHRRLISVIIGEQIREEATENLLVERSRVRSLGSRGATFKTWRR